MRTIFITLIVFASSLATASENGKQMTVKDLARSNLLLVTNLQIQACNKEHPTRAAQFQFALKQFIAKIDHSFEIMLASKRKELETKVPSILFAPQNYITALFSSDGGTSTIEQCLKTVKEIENVSANELAALVEESVSTAAEANIKYAQDMRTKGGSVELFHE